MQQLPWLRSDQVARMIPSSSNAFVSKHLTSWQGWRPNHSGRKFLPSNRERKPVSRKHSSIRPGVNVNAQHRTLSLDMNNQVCLEVRDDGQGLPADYRAGVSLTSMRERAAELRGKCATGPFEAGGTRVFIRLPLLRE